MVSVCNTKNIENYAICFALYSASNSLSNDHNVYFTSKSRPETQLLENDCSFFVHQEVLNNFITSTMDTDAHSMA